MLGNIASCQLTYFSKDQTSQLHTEAKSKLKFLSAPCNNLLSVICAQQAIRLDGRAWERHCLPSSWDVSEGDQARAEVGLCVQLYKYLLNIHLNIHM